MIEFIRMRLILTPSFFTSFIFLDSIWIIYISWLLLVYQNTPLSLTPHSLPFFLQESKSFSSTQCPTALRPAKIPRGRPIHQREGANDHPSPSQHKPTDHQQQQSGNSDDRLCSIFTHRQDRKQAEEDEKEVPFQDPFRIQVQLRVQVTEFKW